MRILYGPVRVSEVLTHPPGFYASLGFTGAILILDRTAPEYLANLKRFHDLEPTLEILPELALSAKPPTWDKAAWDTYGNAVAGQLEALAVPFKWVVLNAEAESDTRGQAAFWHYGGKDQPKQRGQEFGKKLRSLGYFVAVDAIVEAEDKRAWDGGSKNNAFVPFVQGVRPDILFSGNGTGKAAKLGAGALVVEAWLTRQRFDPTQAVSWTQFADLCAAGRKAGVLCVTPEFDGDVFGVLGAGQVERVRALLKG